MTAAQAFLNAFWDEVGDQAEFIYSGAYKTMRSSDMHFKGINFLYEYREGVDVDFVTGLYFYEKLFENVTLNQLWSRKSEYKR